jgi:hypothetical protein
MRNPFIRQFPGFRVESGTDSAKNGKIDYAVTTDLGQGLIIYQSGNSDYVVNKTSKEVVGRSNGNGVISKVIDAVNGDIVIQALNGSITLKAKNLYFEGIDGAGGEIVMTSTKTIVANSSNIDIQSTGDSNVASAKATNVVGTAAADVTASGQATTSSGIDSDSSSFLGQLLQAITKFKEFWNSICVDK